MLEQTDPQVHRLIKKEEQRQREKLSLIASENFFSPAVREAIGSVFSHKYSEGNVGSRYYEGNQNVDELEKLTMQRARDLFSLPDDWAVNVQALSGSNANLAVYLALLEPGDKIMAMYLPDGGHLSHGWSFEPDKEKRKKEKDKTVYLGGNRKVHITTKLFNVVQYKTDPETRMFDYEEVARIAAEHRPKLLITGGTAYPRDIDYKRMRQIADQVGAYYMADIAHEAGLIAAGALPSPVGIADVVTMTTHKTLRSGRGAIILSRKELQSDINRAILPGLQGGPFNHSIAGMCVGLKEAQTPEFVNYAKQIIKNAQLLADELTKKGFNIITNGTDKHLILLDLTNQPLLGKKFARVLDAAGLVTNASSMPQEERGPADPSALRIGTPWATGIGLKEKGMTMIADWINQTMQECADLSDLPFTEFEQEIKNNRNLKNIAEKVKELIRQHQSA